MAAAHLAEQVNSIEVLIADDHPMIVDGLASVIDADPGMRVVARARDGRTALALCRQHRPHVVVLDLQMPGLSGVEVTEMLARTCPQSAVIVFSMHAGDEDLHRCLRAGARAYLMKSALGAEILTAIRTVASGARYLPQPLGERLADRNPYSALTSREEDVLKEIVHGRNNQEIAARLGLQESTVKWHINSLLGKLGVRDRLHAVLTALRRGLARLDDEG